MIKIEVDSVRDDERDGFMCHTATECNIKGRAKAIAEFKAVLKTLEECDRVTLALALTEIITENEEEDEGDD